MLSGAATISQSRSPQAVKIKAAIVFHHSFSHFDNPSTFLSKFSHSDNGCVGSWTGIINIIYEFLTIIILFVGMFYYRVIIHRGTCMFLTIIILSQE